MTHTPGPPNAFDRARTPAQWYCLLAGLSLLLAGLFGFLADAGFETGGDVEGSLFLGFEVNGIHNLVHLASGLVLLAAARGRGPARATAIGFGLVYGLVAVIGLVDGSDVLGLIPVNSADNVLHVALAALGILCGLISRDDARRRSSAPVDRATPPRFGRDEHAGREGARR